MTVLLQFFPDSDSEIILKIFDEAEAYKNGANYFWVTLYIIVILYLLTFTIKKCMCEYHPAIFALT